MSVQMAMDESALKGMVERRLHLRMLGLARRGGYWWMCLPPAHALDHKRGEETWIRVSDLLKKLPGELAADTGFTAPMRPPRSQLPLELRKRHQEVLQRWKHLAAHRRHAGPQGARA